MSKGSETTTRTASWGVRPTGQQAVILGECDRDAFDQRFVDLPDLDLGPDGEGELLADGLQDLLLVQVAEVDDGVEKTLSGLLLAAKRLLELLEAEAGVAQQKLAKPPVHPGGSGHVRHLGTHSLSVSTTTVGARPKLSRITPATSRAASMLG